MKSLITPILLAVSFSASAQLANTRIVSEPAAPSAGQAFNLVITGQWPDGCGAAVRSQTITDFDIKIVMERPRGVICTQAVVDYTLPINPFREGTSARAGTYRVHYELIGENEPNRLLAFTLVPVSDSTSFDFRPDPGNWVAEPGGQYATSGSGVSIALERQGGTMVAVTNFYDAGGKAEWLFGAGAYTAGTANMDLTRVSGGQALFDDYREPQSYEQSGQLLIEFHSPAQATAWFVQSEGSGFLDHHKLMPISIIPFRSLMESVSDVYVGTFVFSTAGDVIASQYQLERIRFGAANMVGSEDAAQDVQLRCMVDSNRDKTLPSRCELYKAGILVAEFTAVGHDLLLGADRQGRQVRLTRG